LALHSACSAARVRHTTPKLICRSVGKQGKYINDQKVLKEAAEKAGVKDADEVLLDANVAADQVLHCSASAGDP
jgi:hypothetical protein